MMSVPMYRAIAESLVLYMPRKWTTWKVATFCVTDGTIAARRKRNTTNLFPLKEKRSIAYAAIVPMIMVPTREMARMIAVLTKPENMLPLFQAVKKLSKFSQLAGGSIGLLSKYSLCVLNAVIKVPVIGRMITKQTSSSDPYFKVANRAPLGPGQRLLRRCFALGRALGGSEA